MKKNHKESLLSKTLVLVIIFLLVIIIVLAFTIIENTKNKNNVHFPVDTPQKIVETNPTPEATEKKSLEKNSIDIPKGFISPSETKELISQLLNNINHPHNTWEIISSSLKKYDVNNDGQEDIVGFIKDKNEYGTFWQFVTWFGKQENYDFYKDGYNDLNFFVSKNEEKKINYETPCEIIDLAIDKITLNCQNGGGSKKTILHYQPNGEGYFVDPEDSLYEFIQKPGLKKFSSKNAGIEFQYPNNLNIVENSYKTKNRYINFIEVRNNGKLLLVIYAFPRTTREGAGVINMSKDDIFLKNLGKESLVRQKYSEEGNNFNFIYRQAEFKKKNNKGSLFNSYNESFVAFEKEYNLYAFVDENQINEIDNIIASTKFFQSTKSNDYKEIKKIPNKKFQMKNVSWELPGTITNHTPENEMIAKNNTKAIVFKDLDVRLINSDFFYPTHIIVKLLPYKNIEFGNPYNDTGFDAEKNKCYHEKYDSKKKKQKVYEEPQIINNNKVCVSEIGDAGYFIESYYIMDPNKKYILSISQTDDGKIMLIDKMFTLDLSTIAKTVVFE